MKKIALIVLLIVFGLSCMIIFCESLPPYKGETQESITEGKSWLIAGVCGGFVALFGIWIMKRNTRFFR